VATIDYETYGRILARLTCRPRAQIGEVLASLGVERADFDRDEPTLRQELSDAWTNRRGTSAMKFAAGLAGELTAGGFPFSRAEPSAAEAALPPRLARPEMALPSFLQPAPLPASPPAPVLPVSPPELPPVHRPPARLAGTAEADLSAIVAAVQRGALPFAASAAPSPASVPEAAKAPPAPPPPGSPSTVALPVMSDEIDLALYPLERYAAVTGALARGEPRDQILSEHHLTPALFEKLAHAWGARFAGDPQLLDRFKALARSSASQSPRKP
jgi:hypothetical protein